jgi:hypothetical protein
MWMNIRRSVRGQIAWLIPQPEVDYGVIYKNINILGRRDGIVVQYFGGGDMYGYNDPNENPDRPAAEESVRMIAELYQRMREKASKSLKPHPPERRRNNLSCPTLRSRNDWQFDETCVGWRVIDSLRRLLIVLRLGPENIGDEGLRIPVVQRKPARLNLYHNPVAWQENVICCR